MERKEEAIDIQGQEVAEIISAEPIAEAAASEVMAAVAGFVVAGPPDEAPQEQEVALHKNGRLNSVLECMLFVSTEPLSAKQLADALAIEVEQVEESMTALESHLDTGSGLQLMHVAGGYQLCTRPEYADYCAMILQPAKKKLSRAALETLAVVLYKQPCTMPEIEAVRGVSVDGVMKTLTERGLVKEAGRKHTPGRPILYATTPEFLQHFGLNDISELPDIDMLAVEEIRALEAQRELFKRHEVTPPPEAESSDE